MIYCLDSCVKFISENAYIQVAINGCHFCAGAKKAFFMIVSNPGTYTAMNIVGWIMTTVGKGVICGLSVFVTVVLA
jgi:choline transporter-like protein 2/4/5